MHPESYDSIGSLAADLKRHAKLLRSIGVTELPGIDTPPSVDELIQKVDRDVAPAPQPVQTTSQPIQIEREPVAPVQVEREPVVEEATQPLASTQAIDERPSPKAEEKHPANTAGSPLPEEIIEKVENAVSEQVKEASTTETQAFKSEKKEEAVVRYESTEEGRECTIFGVGNRQADVFFIGQASVLNHDPEGKPFESPEGDLLARIIEGGMKIPRDEVFVAYLMKNDPENHRDPLPEEIADYQKAILQQIEAVKPKVIVTLGRVAMQVVLSTTNSITRTRGTWQDLNGYPVMPTFDPRYLLRNPDGKKAVWQDIKAVLKRLQD